MSSCEYLDLARLRRDECYCSVHACEYIAVNKIFSTDFNLCPVPACEHDLD